MKKYRLGVSLWGSLAVVLIMLPNILYLFFTPPNDLLSQNDAEFILWNVLENVGRIGLVLALILLKPVQRHKGGFRLLPVFSSLSLLAYYILWAAYFTGFITPPGLLGMAVFPTLFFLCTAISRNNMPAVLFTALFGLVHIAITASNFL